MPTALIIGTNHAFQRRQDCSPENEAIRDAFEKFILAMIRERAIDAIAEEAADDLEVWQHLKNKKQVFKKNGPGSSPGPKLSMLRSQQWQGR